MASAASVARALAVPVLAVGVVLTILNGVVVGYGAVWFQLFGETADAEDYRVSAGGYGAAALIVALAVPATVVRRGPQWLVWLSGLAACALVLLSVRSAVVAQSAEQVHTPISNAWDGIGGVIWAPWTWAIAALGLNAIYRLARERDWSHSRK